MTEQAKPQVEKFQELARQLECDEDEDAFDERLKKLAKAPAVDTRGLKTPAKPKSPSR